MLAVEQLISMVDNLVDIGLKSDGYLILFYGNASTAEYRSCKKIVIKISSYSGKQYILKGYIGVDASEVFERQLLFSELLRENNINTPQHYKFDSNYHYKAKDDGLIVTLEDFIDGSLVELAKETISDYAVLMAKTHVVSELSAFKTGRPAKWYNFSQKNEVIRFDKFLKMRNCGHLNKHKDLCDKIVEKSENLSGLINELICRLPQSAVHGDFSQSNIIKEGHSRQYYIIDFDQAADCNLISDFVLQSSLWIESVDVQNDYGFFRKAESLLKTYSSVRSISQTEAELAMLLYKMSRAFFYKRINLMGSNVIEASDTYRELLEQMDNCLTL